MDYLEQRRKLRQMVQERLDYGRDYTDEEVEDTIDEVLMEQENLELCSVELRRRLRKELFDSLRRLDILQIFVDDSSVTEIMINGLDHIFVERDGQLQELDRAFDSMEKLQDVIQQIVARIFPSFIFTSASSQCMRSSTPASFTISKHRILE